MAAETIASDFSLDIASAQSALKVSGLKAGVAIAEGQTVYIASDGTLKLAVTTQSVVGDQPDFLGIAAHDAAVGENVTVFGVGARFHYSAGLTPGEFFAVSATAGGLEATVTVGLVVAVAINATDILIIPSTWLHA